MEVFSDGFGGWSFLPRAGGLLDQDPLLMDDLVKWRSLVSRARRIRESQEG